MTVTVEKHHGEKVDVKILEQLKGDKAYARKILLVTQNSKRVVQFGLVRIHLDYCSQDVRDEILAGNTPLGRILINHNVLRRIEPTNYLRIIPGPAMMEWFAKKRMRGIVDGSIVVTLDQTRDAMRLMAEKSRVIAEGAGALGLAAALSGHAGRGPIVAIVSGGNIDLPTFAGLIGADH
jgi:hypothetical protein